MTNAKNIIKKLPLKNLREGMRQVENLERKEQ